MKITIGKFLLTMWLFITVVLISGALAQQYDTIAGDLPAVVKASPRPYYVAGDIWVGSGKTVSIEPGTVFLFKNFTGVQVQGKLSAIGTKDRPIIFTSENDREYNHRESPDAAPYDWNGIHIYSDGGGSVLSNCFVLFAVDGIISDTRFIRLNPCTMRNNGRTNLTIEGIEHDVGAGPYDYALSIKDAKLDGVALSVLSDPNAPRRAISRYGGVLLAAGGAVLGIIYSGKYGESSRALNQLSSQDPQNLATHSGDEWRATRTDKRRNAAAMMTGWCLVAAGAIGIGWSFTF